MSVSTETPTGWMPNTTRLTVPDPNFQRGHSGRKAAVLHITEGSYSSACDWFQNPASGVSSHFVVAKDGRIAQGVSVLDTAQANGLSWSSSQQCWIDPQGHPLKAPNPPPSWVGLTPPTNPNLTTVSIEQEGHSGDVQTSAQQQAVASILRFLATLFPPLAPWRHGLTLIGHCDLSTVEKAHCPGSGCQYDAIAQAANGYAHYQIVAPCAVFTARAPDSPLASGPNSGQTWLAPGTVVNVGDVRDGWLWVAPNDVDAPGIGFLPASYARLV